MRDERLLPPLLGSAALHVIIVLLMSVGWYWHSEQKTMAPPAMMKAALVYAPKSTMPQQRTQTQKPEKPKPQPEPPKPEPPKPEPPKPELPKPEVVKPQEKKPEVKPVDKPSPIAAKPEPPKKEPEKKQPEKKPAEKKEPEKKQPEKKPPEKKVEPPKPDAKQAAEKKAAQSAIQKEKISKEADMAIEAALNNEEITRTGELNSEQMGKWVGLIADRIEQNWNRPPNARRGMVVVLQIELSSTGKVINVTTVKSSGDRAFDLAAESAVRKVDTFEDIIRQMKPEEFARFRKFNIEFDPQDLLM